MAEHGSFAPPVARRRMHERDMHQRKQAQANLCFLIALLLFFFLFLYFNFSYIRRVKSASDAKKITSNLEIAEFPDIRYFDESGGKLRGSHTTWVSPDSQPFVRPAFSILAMRWPALILTLSIQNLGNLAQNARHLIFVAGHSVTVSGHLEDAGKDEGDWYEAIKLFSR